MPTYTYECETHGTFDVLAPISQMETTAPCPSCGRKSRKIIVLGHGGVQRNDSEWVRGVSRIFEIDGHRPMETVQDLRQFYRDNPTIKPYESHPAIPSLVGDVKRLPTEKERFAQMSKAAKEFIRKDNAITLTNRTSE